MQYRDSFARPYLDDHTGRRNRRSSHECSRVILQLFRFLLSVLLLSIAIAYGTKIARPIKRLKMGIGPGESSILYGLPDGLDKDDATWAFV